MIEYLQKTLEPIIDKHKFSLLDDNNKQFFKSSYSNFYNCKFCPKNCMPEIFTLNDSLYISCDNDILESPYRINKDDLVRYKFSLSKFFQEISLKNNIIPSHNKLNSKTYRIGEKVINKYDVYFLLDTIDKYNNLTDLAIQRIKSLKADNSRLLIITPDNIIIDNQTETTLKAIHCKIISLSDCLQNDFIIDIQDFNEYDLIVNADTLNICVFGVDYSLSSSIDTFTYIYNLALNPKEILSVEQVRSSNKAYYEDKTLLESTRKMKSRLINGLKSEFTKQNKPITLLDNLINSLNKNESYYLNLNKEKVKIIGNLPA